MKQEQQHISDELLVKCMLGEATAAEVQQVDVWAKQNDANRKYYEHFSLIWNESQKIKHKSTVDANAAWTRFRQKAETKQQPAPPKVIPLSFSFKWMRVAAILVVMIGLGWSVFYFGGNQMTTIAATDKVINHTLPDGTTVTLNKSSVLHYPEEFDGDMRKVELEGEAFFNVTPDKSKPFIIHVDEVDVQVVGTSFNVKSNEEKVEVIVETGIVEVAKKKNMVRLQPREKAVVLTNSDKPVKQQVTDELYNYYRTREFICNGTPLWRLVDVLNEAYNANIAINNPKIADLPLTTTFHNETLDNVLSIVAETLNIKVERNGTDIVLK